MLLSRNFIKMLKGYQKVVAKEIIETMNKSEENRQAYPISIRLFTSMSKTEIFVARELIKQLGDKDELVFAHHDIACELFVSDTVVYETVRVLSVAGVVRSQGIGNKKSVMVALDKDALQQLADIIDVFLER